MQENLFGEDVSHTEVKVRLYCDEIKAYRNARGEQWMYLGILAIPETKYEKALQELQSDRNTCKYPREVHFTALKNHSSARVHNEKTKLAARWAKRVMFDGQKTFYFYLLGLNLDRIQEKAFGKGGRQQKRNIYNRFFRASIKGMLKYFFRASDVIVTRIFHDMSELEDDDYFDWHTIWRLESSERWVSFATSSVDFIDSDHNKEPNYPEDSHFIQLCDVLLGGFTQSLDARNGKDGCCEIGELLLPLAERLVDKWGPYNRESHFHSYRRISFGFFPSKALSLEELDDGHARARAGYYHERKLLVNSQPSLFED